MFNNLLITQVPYAYGLFGPVPFELPVGADQE